MEIQTNLFKSNEEVIKEEKEKLPPEIRELEKYDREYCLKQIENEEFLWDMRCWDKPKKQYTIEEVIIQIRKWLDSPVWGCNCSHTLFCIEMLLKNDWATKEEIAKAVMGNNKIQYPDEIGTWENL